jgi:hypothetical protein
LINTILSAVKFELIVFVAFMAVRPSFGIDKSIFDGAVSVSPRTDAYDRHLTCHSTKSLFDNSLSDKG